MTPFSFGAIVPLLLTLFLRNSANSTKRRGVPADAAGDPGFSVRNHRFGWPVETAWEGVSTLAELFEEACKKHGERFLLGTRKLISREVEISKEGRSSEKVHLGEYEWLTYGDAFEAVSSFASGLARLGHVREERAAIFADTRQEWFLALQVQSLPFNLLHI